MSLLERIDIALSAVGKSRHELADEIELSRQAIYRLARRPGSTLKPENIAHASKALQCDLYWLCTGEGGRYVPAQGGASFSFLAIEVAKLLDSMPERERERAFSVIYRLTQGQWPTGFTGDAKPLPPSDTPPRGNSGKPTDNRPKRPRA